MKKAETVIIGGGVVGASIAYHMTERGAKDVLILERENTLGLGSTGKATGGIRAQFGTEININLSLYSLDFLEKFNDLTGGDCGYEPRGYLFLATDEQQLDFLKRSIELQRATGYRDVEIVDTETIAKLVPGLNCDDIVGGSFGARDGFIDPLGILNGFAVKAKENGATIEMCREVTAIETHGGRVIGVTTNDGTIECENAVLCSGAWAGPLAKTAGIDLPVEPLKRQIVWAKCERELPARLPMVIDLSNGFHFRPAATTPSAKPGHPSSGRREVSTTEILFAYPDKDELPGANTDFDEAFIEKVYDKARHRAPFLCETEVVQEKCRAGLYENSPDHHAILGKCEIEGLYLANGFSGHGVMHSPATGRALAEIILDGEAKFLDVSCLSFSRFANGKLLHEPAYI